MNIYEAISAVMAEVEPIAKARQNTQQNYGFRGIDDMYNALNPILPKYGIFFAPNVLSKEREERATKSGGVLMYTVLMVEYTVYAADGTNIKLVTIGEAMDSGDKSSNKAMSTALKYAVMQLFCIPTEDEKDTENHSPEPAPRAAVASPVAPQSTPAPQQAQSTKHCAVCNKEFIVNPQYPKGLNCSAACGVKYKAGERYTSQEEFVDELSTKAGEIGQDMASG